MLRLLNKREGELVATLASLSPQFPPDKNSSFMMYKSFPKEFTTREKSGDEINSTTKLNRWNLTKHSEHYFKA